MSNLEVYLYSFTITNGKPHRPVLLLALAKLVVENPLHSEVFKPTDEALLSNYDVLWRAMGAQGNSNVHYPFFALGKTNFWNLIAHSGREEDLSKDSMRSFRELSDTIDHVEIDSGLMQLLRNPIDNKRFVDEVYARFMNKQATPSEEQLELFRDQRADAAYASLLLEPEEFVRKVVTKEKDTGEIYVRNADFKRLIPDIYDHPCAGFGSRIALRLKHVG